MGPEETPELKSEPLEESFRIVEVKMEQDSESTDSSISSDSDPEKQPKRKKSAERFPSSTYSKMSDRPSKAPFYLLNLNAGVSNAACASGLLTVPESSVCISTRELITKHQETCVKILELVAPLKISQPKYTPHLWLNETTQAARRQCKKAEHKRKKDKLQAADMGPEETQEIKSEPLEESFEIVEVKMDQDSESTDFLTTSDSDPEKQPKRKRSVERYPCPTFGKVSDRPSKVERHKPVHNRKSKLLHQCQHCEKSFTQEEKLIQHQKVHNRSNEHSCPDCGKVLSSLSKLERHKHMHSRKPKALHQCSFCMKTFGKPHRLIRHERVHTGEKPFTCPVCGKGFAEAGNCKAHEKTHEVQPEKPHSCTDCEMSFFKASELRRHFRSHTGDKPFRCTLCDRCYSRSEGLKIHMRSHTGERPFKCTICSKGFYSRLCLSTHSLIHSGEKPHVCSMCGKGFSQLGNMKDHEQKVHNKSENYICNECGATFTQNKSMMEHQRIHTGEKRYSCLICGRKFSWSHSLSRHRRTHGPKQMSLETSKGSESFEGQSEDSAVEIKSDNPL